MINDSAIATKANWRACTNHFQALNLPVSKSYPELFEVFVGNAHNFNLEVRDRIRLGLSVESVREG